MTIALLIAADVCMFVCFQWAFLQMKRWKRSAESRQRTAAYYRDTLESLHKRGMIRKEQKRGSNGRWVK